MSDYRFAIIDNFPDHRICIDGTVETRKIRGSDNLGEWRKMRVFRAQNGYDHVTLRHNGKPKTFRIHRLLAEYFIPNLDNKEQVNHINGNKHDNRIENLEWCTPKENMRHAFVNGLVKRGGGAYSKNLDDIKVLTIRTLASCGWRNGEIGEHYKLAKNTISQIKTGANWKHLPLVHR